MTCPNRPDPVPLIDALERAHDGPPPPMALAVARAGGRAAWLAGQAASARAWAAGDCAAARLAAARRRAMLPARQVRGDAWLLRLTTRLARARERAVAP